MKKYVSLFYKLFIVCLGLVGILLNILYDGFLNVWNYYNIISNFICILFFLFMIIYEMFDLKKERKYIVCKLSLMVMIVVNMCIPYFMIDGGQTYSLAHNIVYTFVPILTIVDYFVFDEKGKMKWSYAFISLVIPFVYILFVYVYSSVGGKFGGNAFPYYFLDYNQLGIGSVILYILVGIVVIFLIGEVIVFIDKLMGGE